MTSFDSKGGSPDGMPEPDTWNNTDEMSPESGRFGKFYVKMAGGRRHSQKKRRIWRLKTGEHSPFHATGVITVCGDGTFKPKISGVVHQGGGGGNGSLDLKLGSRSFFHVTSSGHMDEVGFALRAHFHTRIFSQFRYRSPPPKM